MEQAGLPPRMESSRLLEADGSFDSRWKYLYAGALAIQDERLENHCPKTTAQIRLRPTDDPSGRSSKGDYSRSLYVPLLSL